MIKLIENKKFNRLLPNKSILGIKCGFYYDGEIYNLDNFLKDFKGTVNYNNKTIDFIIEPGNHFCEENMFEGTIWFDINKKDLNKYLQKLEAPSDININDINIDIDPCLWVY